MPTDIPAHIDVDLSNLKLNDSIHVRDLVVSDKIKVLTDPDVLLFQVKLHVEEKVDEAAAEQAPELEVIREKKDVVTIPERLVTFEDGGKKAFVELPGKNPKDEPKKVEIKTGISDGLNIEVTAGVKKGDQLVQRPPKTIS